MSDKQTPKHFTFEHDGKTYTFEKGFEVVRSPRWLRANRRRDELDLAFTIIEEVAGEDALEAIDDMDEDEFNDLAKRLNKELGDSLGKLIGLLDLLDDYEDPIAYDCIRAGVRLRDLGTDAFTWGDLRVIVQWSGQDSALYRAMNPDDHQWSLANLLIAEAVDHLAVANWQRGSGKKKDYPRPLPRPGVEPETATYGKDAIPMDEMAEWLGWATA